MLRTSSLIHVLVGDIVFEENPQWMASLYPAEERRTEIIANQFEHVNVVPVKLLELLPVVVDVLVFFLDRALEMNIAGYQVTKGT